MEERFDAMKCPVCGSEMERGITVQAYDHPLIWAPGQKAVSYSDAIRLSWGKEAKEDGARRFTSRFRTKPSYFPAWYCEECGLMTIDTKTEMEKA